MTKQMMKWNGLSLEISAEPNALLSRLSGEEFTNLKVTSAASAKPLINDTFAMSLIQSAGGAANFVDVMLSAELQQAA